MIKAKAFRSLRLSLLFVSIFFVQCTKEVIVPLPFYESASVLNSFIRKDSVLTLTLSKSLPINEEGIKRISNANISLYQNDSFFDSLYTTGDGVYQSHKKISQSNSYRISAQFDDETLNSYDYLPESPQLLSLSRTDLAGYNEEGNSYGSLEIELFDEDLQDDYYEIEIIYVSIERQRYYQIYPYTENDIVILNENLPQFSQRQSFPFSDELFNGKKVKIIFNYSTPKSIINDVTREWDPDYQLIVKFRKTSKNYYLYRKSVINHYEGQESDLWNGIGNSITVYSNVEGGMGIFAAYSEIVDTLKRIDP